MSDGTVRNPETPFRALRSYFGQLEIGRSVRRDELSTRARRADPCAIATAGTTLFCRGVLCWSSRASSVWARMLVRPAPGRAYSGALSVWFT
jgi:hypothetical protein